MKFNEKDKTVEMSSAEVWDNEIMKDTFYFQDTKINIYKGYVVKEIISKS